MRFLLVCFFTLSLLHGEQKERISDLSKLTDKESAFDEVKRLIEGKNSRSKLKRTWIYQAPQQDGEKLTAVLADWDYFSEKDYVGPWGYEIDDPEELFDKDRAEEKFVTVPSLKRISEADIMLFDAGGKEVKPFAGNVRIDSGYVYDFNGDGILDRAERWNAGGTDGLVAHVFLVGSIERSPRRLLEVIYNCHHEKESEMNEWSFRCSDEDGDGLVEIGFGPLGSDLDEVVYDWDVESGEYRVRGGKEHPHLRVLAHGETASEIAANFRYPILQKRREPVLKSGPYLFVSLKGEDHEKYREFFNGREAVPDPGWDWGNWRDDKLPDRLWKGDPKKIAMEMVEKNRTEKHRREYQLAMDERDGVKPPEAGWLYYYGGLSGIQAVHSNSRMIRFGKKNSAIYVIEWASVRNDPESRYLFESNYRVRKINFPDEKAKHLADVIFWLDRIRSRKRGKDGAEWAGGRTHDGFGLLSSYPDGKPTREIGLGTVWKIGSIRGNWKGNYNREVMVNFVDLLWRDGMRDFLKEDGEKWPDDFDREENRAQLIADIREILANGRSDSLPVEFVENLVPVIGNSGLLELGAEIEELEKSLPAKVSAEERELRRYQGMRHDTKAEDPFNFDPAEFQKSMSFLELEARLRFDRSWVLRDDLETTREQFSLLKDEEKLKQAVLEDGRFDEWASPFLKSRSLDEWAEVMTRKFKKSKDWKREQIFHDMAVAHPAAAENLVEQMNDETKKELFFEIARFRLKEFPKKAVSMLPAMLEIVRDRAEEAGRRSYVMELISEMELGPEKEEELRKIIKAEVANPTKITWSDSTAEIALKALNNLKPQEGDLEYFWSQPSFLKLRSDEGLAILKKQISNEEEYLKAAEKYLGSQLSNETGDVEIIALLALAMDLRKLAPQLKKKATEHSQIPDGRAYEKNRWDKFHLSRYIVALWKEKDQETLAKMWIDFITGQFLRLSEEEDSADDLKKRVREAVQVLDPQLRARWIDETLSHHNFRNRGKAERWLRSLK